MLTTHPLPGNAWRERIVGLERRVPLLDGRLAPYVSLDNAASTPALREVLEAVESFLPYYSSVHRGTGFKSRLRTAAYDKAHSTIARLVGADPRTATVIFGKNTTEAINKLAFRFPLAPHQVVLSTVMEHHSNDLPWRRRAQVVRAAVTPDGRLDEDDVDRLLAAYGDRVALLTVSGASNVTGFIQPIHRLARKAHAVGARILVDAAQLAPHRHIDVKTEDDPEHLDYVVAFRSQDVRPVRHRCAGGALRTPSCKAPRNIRAVEQSKSSRRPTSTGQAFPIARKPAAPTWSARWPWRSRRRHSWTTAWTTSPGTSAR